MSKSLQTFEVSCWPANSKPHRTFHSDKNAATKAARNYSRLNTGWLVNVYANDSADAIAVFGNGKAVRS